MNYKLVDKITGRGYEHVKNNDVEHWHKNGNLHRLDGPAYIFYEDGNVTVERWYKDNKLHRLEGPARLYYDKDGNVTAEYWHKDNKCHRLGGPAIIRYEDGNVTVEYWFKDSKELYKEDFTNLDMISQFKAYSLFTPIELVRVRDDL